MRKVAICLISFLTLGTLSESIWGTYYTNKLDGRDYEVEDLKDMTNILGDMERFGRTAGNYLVASISSKRDYKGNEKQMNERRNNLVLLTSGGGEHMGQKLIDTPGVGEWTRRCESVGLGEILSFITKEDSKKIKQIIEEILTKDKPQNIGDDDLKLISHGLVEYFEQVMDWVSGIKFDEEEDRRADEGRNFDTYVVINPKCQILGMTLLKRIDEVKNLKRKFNILKSLFIFFDASSVGVIRNEALKKAQSLLEDTPNVTFEVYAYNLLLKNGNITGRNSKRDEDAKKVKMASCWIKRSTHTEVLLHWMTEKGMIDLRNGFPILSWKNPCQSCARLPWLEEWCGQARDKGFFWLHRDNMANRSAGGRINNKISDLKAYDLDTTQPQGAKNIRCTLINEEEQ